MIHWPEKPFIYQINTWVWLNTLSRICNKRITLQNVPDEALDEIASYGLDAVWLMGVWARSPKAAASAREYVHEYRSALSDVASDDIIGSAYAVYDYRVDDRIGGPDGLAALRKRLKQRGLRLILDYVPNHVALDHQWVREFPTYLIQGTARDLSNRPSDFYGATDNWGRELVVAHGRDPYFPGWSDTAQVNAFSPEYRRAALESILKIAGQCDGIRCDMAMLLLNRVFERTWKGYYIESIPSLEFWDELIPRVRAAYPGFLFMAEVYWNMEYDLQQLGFDLTYDKLLYDRLKGSSPREVRVHLIADVGYQKRLVRFIENHDEPRAYTAFGAQKSRPAAVLISTLPGAVLLHDGQFSGRRAKLPVQIGRAPIEPVDTALQSFYRRLLAEMRSEIYQTGDWYLLNLFPAWNNNPTYDNLIAYGWSTDKEYRLVVINLTAVRSQALVNLSVWHGIAERDWLLEDTLNGHSYTRSGRAMSHPGLYIDLEPYESHIFRFQPLIP